MSLEQLLQSTIAPDLDRQKGRAAAAFSQFVQSQPMAHPQDRRAARRLKIWAVAASSLAACLAAVVTLKVWMNAEPAASIPGNIAAANSPVVDEVVYTRNLDGGTVLMNDSPVRVIRRQTVKQTQWTDPRDGATYTITQPAENVGYERVQPY